MKKWIAILNDGKTVEEGQVVWNDIKDFVSYLHLNNNGQNIYLPKNLEKYEQSKTASANLINGQVEIESRNISAKLGNNTLRIRVNEKTNNISIEIS